MITLKLLISPIRGADGSLRHTFAQFPDGAAICDMLPDTFEGAYILDGRKLSGEDDPYYRMPLYHEHEVWAIPDIGEPFSLTWFLVLGGSLVLGIGLSVAATYLFAPPKPEFVAAGEESSPTTSFRGITTSQGPGAPVPVIYGRHRVGGQLLHADVGYNDQDQAFGAFPDSPLDMLIAIGEGYIDEIETATIELNDQPVANFVDIQTATTNGTSGQSALPHHENIQQTFARSPADDLTSGIVTYTTTQDVNGFVIELRYPNGLYYAEDDGDFVRNSTTWRFRYRVSPAGGWSGYTTVTNGASLRDVLYSTQKIENLALDTYDIELEYVSSDRTGQFDAWQPYLYNMTEIIDQTNRYLNTALLGLRTVSQSGLEGSLPNVTVIVKGRRVRVGKFSDETITGATNASPIEITTNTTHAFSSNDIIRIMGVGGNTAANGTWTVTNTGTNTFTLNGSTGNGTYTSGGIAVEEEWSDNPAWCLMDLLTHDRYGLAIPDSQIDLAAFTTYAAYCDALVDNGASGTEKRCLLDLVLDTDQTAQDAVLRILGTTRAILIKTQGLWRPRVSQDDSPVQLISWSNIVRDSLRIDYRKDIDAINVMEGQFANRDLDFDADVLTWPTSDNWPLQIRKAGAQIAGITRPSQAIRELQFELARRQLSKLFVSFRAGIDQIVLERHDIFRFSHPMPAWGQAGRVAAGDNSLTHIVLDESVAISAGFAYHIYVRHDDDTVDVRVLNTLNAPFTAREFDLDTGEPNFSSIPAAGDALWAIGETSPEGAIKLFRVVDLQLTENFEVDITAVEHNATVFNDETPIPVPTITRLFNPLGPPPPLLSLYATSNDYLGLDGIPRPLVRLTWEVKSQQDAGNAYAKYYGALIFRRYVRINAQGGRGTLGEVALSAIVGATATFDEYELVGNVSGGSTTSYVDRDVVSGVTYQYKVVPTSLRGVPNDLGSQTVEITVSGGGKQSAVPPAPTFLRLLNGDTATTFSTQDAQFAWASPVSDLVYLVEIWDTSRATRLRGPLTISDHKFTYTRDQNEADSARILGMIPGDVAATRAFYISVRSKNRYGLLSSAVTLSVSNPAPDMSSIAPSIFAVTAGLQISWSQFAEPLDLTKYQLYVDTVTPPVTLIKEASKVDQVVWVLGLEIGTLHYVQIVPYDIYGAGTSSQISSGTPLAIDGGDVELDTTPPATPTGLSLGTGNVVSDDGTIIPFVTADWNDNVESDLSHYQVNYRIGSVAFSTLADVSEIRFDAVPGNTTVYVKVKAVDKLGNASAFTSESNITTSTDTSAPAAPSSLNVTGTFRANALLWTPPSDADLDVIEIWARQTTNDYGALSGGDPSLATRVGSTKKHSFIHGGLGSAQTWYYWIRGIDTSGNKGNFNTGQTAGTQGITVKAGGGDVLTTEAIITAAAQIQNALITDAHVSNLSAAKLIAGTVEVLVKLGVNNIEIDGVNDRILIKDSQGTPQTRVIIGKLGAGATDWGIQVYDSSGSIVFQSGASISYGTSVVWSGNQITTGNISTFIQSAAIGTAYIANAAITNAKIGSLAVATANIQNLNVTTLKILGEAVSERVVQSDDEVTSVSTLTTIVSASITTEDVSGSGDYGTIILMGKCYAYDQSNLVLLDIFRTGGPLIDTTTVEIANGTVESQCLTCMGIYTPTSAATNTFELRFQSTGVSQTVAYSKLIAYYVKK